MTSNEGSVHLYSILNVYFNIAGTMYAHDLELGSY